MDAATKNNVKTSKSKFVSVIRQRCPRCYEGNLFATQNPYNLKMGTKMYDACPACNQDFKIEPGFYIGALWTSFPIVILIMAVLSILLLVYFRLSLNTFFVLLTLFLFLLQPIITRLGRSIWIHIFVRYNPDAVNSTKA